MAIPTIPDIRTLMEAGVHFGHASGKWHPKMKPYIFATRDKLHIIDLEKTREQLVSVLTILEERVRSGKIIVLVGTKKQASEQVKEIGEKLGIPYVNVRWLGGTMTNFREIQKSIARMKKMEAYLESPDSVNMIKKERVMQTQEIERMRAKFGGLRNLTRKPDALFIIDPSHEHNAVKEALVEGIELFAVIDTNSDPSVINHVIPANDDGAKSLKLILGLVEATIAEGQKMVSLAKDEKATKEAEAEVEVAIAEDPVLEESLDKVEEVLKEEDTKKPAKASVEKEEVVEAKK
jgi:small subunit ribosomal protein S2